ncbi:MAG: A/G-specific adenine glycosylase [Spirochaetaceae bacterium]|jgi:A/G-specific adenine glycosylase|nr:A/G-specific adenine glycosylase [Spirochaetaceae bacterium]
MLNEFRQAIWDNYRRNPRRFPWRETSDPYEILVSEIMLQQTQTERVIPKYTAWLEAFPNASSLAKASLPEVLRLWNGLGYNRRARFLQEACRIVTEKSGGVFPRDPDELDALPGIGPYTARAVAAFAFGSPEVFIETNIRSVYIFFFFPDAEKVDDKELLPLIEQTLDREHPREWYYALMDYGAALKKSVKNPSRRSSSYAKQSKFDGSLRQARGAILRALISDEALTSDETFILEDPAPEYGNKLSLSYIAEKEGIDMDRIRKAALSLCSEGLLVCEDEICYIPDPQRRDPV